jgi:4-amino-4-deoxy-L-arabinose transferase-like glycosyltransferase
VLLVGLLLFLPGLGNHDLWAPDEPRYAQVAREMLRSGDWLLPHVNGRIFADKPPGWYWCAALLALPAGDVTPFTARLPSALAATALLLLTAAAGARLLGRRAGLLGSLVLAGSYLFFSLARSAQLDMLLCFLITVGLLAAWRAMMEGGGRVSCLVVWSTLGAAVLVKGPVGLVVPAVVLIADRLVARQPADLRKLCPAWGLPLAVLLPLGWLLAAAALRPGYSPAEVLDRHVLSRFSEGLHHARPFWYYGVYFFGEMLPWSFLVPAAVALAWAWRRDPAAAPEREDEVAAGPASIRWARRRFLLVWVAAVLVFFSISSEKRGIYILPLFPAAALLVGDLWSRLLQRSPSSPRPVAGLVAAGLVMPGVVFLMLAAVPFLLGRWPEEVAALLRPTAIVLAVIGAAAGAALLILALRRRWAAALATLAAAALAVLLVFSHGVEPALNSLKSARGLSETLAAERRPGEAVGMLEWRAAYLYYSGVRMKELASRQAVVEWFTRPGGRLLLVEEEHFRALAPELGPLEVVARDGVGHRRMVLARKPSPG